VTLAHSGFGQKNRGGWGRRKPDSGLSSGEEDSKNKERQPPFGSSVPAVAVWERTG